MERQPRLLTEPEIAEIREGLRLGLRGPVLTKWAEQLLADHDERVRLERERAAAPAQERRDEGATTRET